MSKALSKHLEDDKNSQEEEINDSDEEELVQHQYKVVVLGDGAVGKTSICMRFTEDHFAQQYKQTIGLDFFIKKLVLPGDVYVALQIWDIGGQSVGSKMIKNYIFGADAVLLCYDITNYESFQNLDEWIGLVERACTEATMPYLALVGNKICSFSDNREYLEHIYLAEDLEHVRTVKSEKHLRLADERSMFGYFMSAKAGDNVHSVFFKIAADLAGIALSKNELDSATKVVEAQIINHPQDDPHQPAATIPKSGSRCSLQ
eukprot:931678_1